MTSIIRQITGYPLSSDYEDLWLLAQKQSIVCLVDYKRDAAEGLQDVAQTLAIPMGEGRWSIHISCRGVEYVSGYDKETFVKQCRSANVQWLVPNNA